MGKSAMIQGSGSRRTKIVHKKEKNEEFFFVECSVVRGSSPGAMCFLSTGDQHYIP